MKILHLEDNPSDALIIERGVQRQGLQACFIQARGHNEFSAALQAGGFDVVLVDNNLPGYSARDAIAQAKASYPDVPVIVCSGAAQDAEVADAFAAGADDYVLKDHLWQLTAALRRIARPAASAAPPPTAMMLLVDVVQKLSLARGPDAIADIVREAKQHECTPQELMLLEALANTTAVAMKNIEMYQNLERQLRERTRELQAVKQQLLDRPEATKNDD